MRRKSGGVPKSEGARLLAAEIKRRGITRAAAALELGVSHVTLHFWLNDAHRPSGSRRELIEAWSGGRVSRDIWLSTKDRALMAAARRGAA